MSDRISLTGLRAQGTHGVLDHEKVEPQDFVVDVDLWLETSDAVESDDVAQTVSYADVADEIVAIIEGEHADLIETLAHRMITRLSEFPVDGIAVTVHKPHAPIPHQFEDVSVTMEWWRTIEPDTYEVVISLGSNLDHPHIHIRSAVEEIGISYDVLAVSGIYETAPLLEEGQTPQPNYMNAVIMVRTSKELEHVLEDLQFIEDQHGRVRDARWGARTLDLDIIKAAHFASNSPRLTIPHPRAHLRRFVLEPWLEIEPEATLAGRRVDEIVANLPDQGVRRVDALSEAIALPAFWPPVAADSASGNGSDGSASGNGLAGTAGTASADGLADVDGSASGNGSAGPDGLADAVDSTSAGDSATAVPRTGSVAPARSASSAPPESQFPDVL